MKVVSFYTSDNEFAGDYYSTAATELIAQADELGLEHVVVNFDPQPITDAEDWFSVTRIKPLLLLTLLNRFQEDLLWVDADCKLVKLPVIHDLNLINLTLKPSKQPAVFTLWIPNNQHSRSTLWKWYEACLSGQAGDHDELLRLWPTIKENFAVFVEAPAVLESESGNYQKTKLWRKRHGR